MAEEVYTGTGRKNLSFSGFAILMKSNGYELVRRRKDFQEFSDGKTKVYYKSRNGLGVFSSATITAEGDRSGIAKLEKLIAQVSKI